MAERAFEADLESWFADIPAMADAHLFASRVTDRLERSWTFRRLVIGGLGLVGGLIGSAQVLGSGLLSRLGSVDARPGSVTHVLADRFQDSSFAQSPLVHDTVARLSTLGGGNAEALWMSVALALFAAGLLITRAVREF